MEKSATENKMSLGFVSRTGLPTTCTRESQDRNEVHTPAHRHWNVNRSADWNEDPNAHRNATSRRFKVTYMLVAAISIAEFVHLQGFVKSDHQHPHVDSERDLQNFNIYINLILVYLSFNVVFLPLTQRWHDPRWVTYTYCILWGGALSMMMPIELGHIVVARVDLILMYGALVTLVVLNLMVLNVAGVR
jgi:hypothetical protein